MNNEELKNYRDTADHLKKLIELNGDGNNYHFELFKGYPELVSELISQLEKNSPITTLNEGVTYQLKVKDKEYVIDIEKDRLFKLL
jgi:methionyl-tRNA formyltransferase